MQQQYLSQEFKWEAIQLQTWIPAFLTLFGIQLAFARNMAGWGNRKRFDWILNDHSQKIGFLIRITPEGYYFTLRYRWRQ